MAKYIGSHVGMKAPLYFEGSVLETLENEATTLMLYTGAPQNKARTPLEKLHIQEARRLIEEKGLCLEKMIAHAPYLINLANSNSLETLAFSKEMLLNELRRVEAMGIPVLVLHPGSHVGAGKEKGLLTLIKSLNEVLNEDTTHVIIALETMAGKGSEVGSTLEELRFVYDHIEKKEKIGFCLDTCHLWDGGYDIEDVDTFIKKVDTILGLENIKVIHLNDSKNEKRSHKDRHANLGAGKIGFPTLSHFFHHPLLDEIPFILETPYIEEKSPYKEEISRLRHSDL